MWQAAKVVSLGIALVGLSACTSLFSAYDSDFSCKNSDHGSCAHPLSAYEQARNGLSADHAVQSMVEPRSDHADGESHDHELLPKSDYQSYQEAVYSELQGLVSDPDTPILAPAKIVRTLILPYTDPKQSSRLYMPRYVYSVLENSKFVLGDYLVRRDVGLRLEDLLSKPDAAASQERE